jgi:hypothetical protein
LIKTKQFLHLGKWITLIFSRRIHFKKI